MNSIKLSEILIVPSHCRSRDTLVARTLRVHRLRSGIGVRSAQRFRSVVLQKHSSRTYCGLRRQATGRPDGCSSRLHGAISVLPRIAKEKAEILVRLPKCIRDIAWKAQTRLCTRYRTMVARGKKPTVVVAAIARELAGFIWAIGREMRANILPREPLHLHQQP